MKLAQIASALKARLESGNPSAEITGLNGIEQAGPREITFVANPKYAAAARLTKAAAVIVAENFPAIPAAKSRFRQASRSHPTRPCSWSRMRKPDIAGVSRSRQMAR